MLILLMEATHLILMLIPPEAYIRYPHLGKMPDQS